MFEDSLMESAGKLKTKRGWTTMFSFVVQIVLIKVVVESLTIEGLIEIVVEIFIVAGVFGRSRHAVAFKVALSLRDRNADEKQSWVEPISPETRSAFLPQSDRAT